MYKRNNEVRSRNHCCHGKAIIITYSECVCLQSVVIQHAMRMRCIISVACLPACLPVPHFFTLSHKWHDFRGKNLLNVICVVLIFSTTFIPEQFSF